MVEEVLIRTGTPAEAGPEFSAHAVRVRERRGFEGALPTAGDKLVCLRNNRKKGLFNGGLWRVKSRTQPRAKSKILTMRLSPDEVSAIETLDRNGRQIDPSWSPPWD